jgi:hypothetical protein
MHHLLSTFSSSISSNLPSPSNACVELRGVGFAFSYSAACVCEPSMADLTQPCWDSFLPLLTSLIKIKSCNLNPDILQISPGI